MSDATLKTAVLISKITHICAQELQEGDIRTILQAASEVRADDTALNRLLGAISRGQKIEAIKEYRALTGASLIDAKNAVEAALMHPAGVASSPSEYGGCAAG